MTHNYLLPQLAPDQKTVPPCPDDLTPNHIPYPNLTPKILSKTFPNPPFLSPHGAQTGGIRVFPVIKIAIVCQVRIYCSLSVKINMREMPHCAWRSWKYFVCVCFHVCGRQKPKYPQFEPHGWQGHYIGWFRGLVFLFYVCGCPTSLYFELSLATLYMAHWIFLGTPLYSLVSIISPTCASIFICLFLSLTTIYCFFSWSLYFRSWTFWFRTWS